MDATTKQEERLDCILPPAKRSSEWWKERALEMLLAPADFDNPERPMRVIIEFVRLTLYVQRLKARIPYAEFLARFIGVSKGESFKVRDWVDEVAATGMWDVKWEGPKKRQTLTVSANLNPTSWNWKAGRRFSPEEARYVEHWRKVHQQHDPNTPLDFGRAERFRQAAIGMLWAEDLSLNEALSAGDIMAPCPAPELHQEKRVPQENGTGRFSESVPASREPADRTAGVTARPEDLHDTSPPNPDGVGETSLAGGIESPGCVVAQPPTRPSGEELHGSLVPCGNLTDPEAKADGSVILYAPPSSPQGQLDGPIPPSTPCDGGTLSRDKETLEEQLARLARKYAETPVEPAHLKGGNGSEEPIHLKGGSSTKKVEAPPDITRARVTGTGKDGNEIPVTVPVDRGRMERMQQLLCDLDAIFSGEVEIGGRKYCVPCCPGEMLQSRELWWTAANRAQDELEAAIGELLTKVKEGETIESPNRLLTWLFKRKVGDRWVKLYPHRGRAPKRPEARS